MPKPIATSTTAAVSRLAVEAFTIPTDAPESDGTLEWHATTIVVVHVTAGRATGLGFTYGDVAVASIVDRVLAPQVIGRDAVDIEAAYVAMVHAVRNIGLQGVAASAISAVDIAMWDAKARLLDVPLVTLLPSGSGVTGANRSRKYDRRPNA